MTSFWISGASILAAFDIAKAGGPVEQIEPSYEHSSGLSNKFRITPHLLISGQKVPFCFAARSIIQIDRDPKVPWLSLLFLMSREAGSAYQPLSPNDLGSFVFNKALSP
jgi:hypothetical protein